MPIRRNATTHISVDMDAPVPTPSMIVKTAENKAVTEPTVRTIMNTLESNGFDAIYSFSLFTAFICRLSVWQFMSEIQASPRTVTLFHKTTYAGRVHNHDNITPLHSIVYLADSRTCLPTDNKHLKPCRSSENADPT